MIFIFCLFYLVINQETENQVLYLQVGESVQGFISPRTSNHHVYQFVVPEIKNQIDLVVLLKTLNPNSDPNIYISKSVQEPLSIQDADVQACEAEGMDICIINNQKIKENDLLYISVVSLVPSRYLLRIELDQEQTLMIDSFLTFKMTFEKQSQILDFIIPEFHEQETEIQINVQVVNQEQLEEPFQVFMNLNENGVPNNDKFDYKAIDTWENQKVIEFIQQKPFEQYKILIQGEQGAVFRVSATRNQYLKTVNLYESIIQVVDKGDYDFYKTEVYNPFDCDIVIRLTPFKGYAKLFVHYNIQPPLLDSYEWKEDNQEGELIYISRKELLDKNIIINNLYIAVFGEDLCTYRLQCTCEQQGYILPDIRYQRIVKQQEIMRLEIIDYQNEIHQILVNFHILQGILNILITNCFDQYLCPSEELFVNQEKYEKMTEYIMIYSNYQQQPQFMLNCDYVCNYQIFVIVDRNSKSDGKFEVQYKINKKTTNLIQNTPHKSIIQKNQYQNYQFFVSENDEIQRLHFIVSLTQGEVTIYLSTKYQKPNEENYEYKSQNNSINFDGRFSNQPQPGNYYISIYGQSVSKYMITVWVIKNFEDSQQFGKFHWHYIQLYQGDWHDHYLVNDDFVLFKIDLKGYQNTQNYPLNVILYKNYGQFQMFGFDHPETNELKAIWQSGQIINIQMNDLKYPEILYLKIKLDQTQDIYGSFRIAFYFYDQEINLLQNEPFFNFLYAENQQNFRYEYSKKESFLISKRSFEFNQSSLLFESFNQYGLEIKKFENTNIILVENKEEIYCQDQQKICSQYFYFSLYSKIDQFYSILISNSDNPEIQLGEDQPISKLLPIGEDYFYLFCQGQEVNILAFSFYRELKIYASIVKDLKSPHPNSLQFDKMSIRGKRSYQASLYFTQNELENYNCVEKCIIKLTVVVSNDIISDINDYYDYTIQYNSKLILLRESEFQDGYLTQSGYKFYKIHVSNNDTNLMILLKPDPNYEAGLLVSKSKFPNQEKFDWASFDLYSDVLILEPGNSIHPDLPGDYYVGVLCTLPCQFSLQYHLGKVETYDIFPNQPYKFYVGADYTVFLNLYTYMQTSPQMIFVQSLSETAYFYVDEIDYFTSKLSYTKNLSSFKYNNYQRGYQKQMVTESLQFDTMLLIALKTYNSEIVTIQVSSQDEEIFLDSQMLFQYQLEKNQKVTFTLNPIHQPLIIQIYVFSGQITCSYSIENLNSNENFHAVLFLELKSDNYKNNFIINNYTDSYINVYFEAIFNSHFSIQYFYEIEDAIYIDSIYPVNVQLKGQSEKKLYYNNFDISQSQTQQKTFQISVQIQEEWNAVLSNQKHRSLPIIKVYSYITGEQLQPIKQKILSNLIFNEYIQSETVYTIVLNNQAQFYQNYEIQIGNSDLRPLVSRIKQLGTNQLHTSTYWALQQNYVYIFYEMQFCNGIFSVHVGKDFELLKSGQYDYKIDIKQNKQVFGFIDKFDQANFIYLKFDFIKAFNNQILDAQYTIRIYSVEEKSDIPYDQFYPGLQGILTSKITQNYEENITLYIEFAPLQFNQKNEQDTFWVEQIEYFIILNERYDDDDNNNFDYCTEPSNENRIFHNQTDNDNLLTINVTLPNFRKLQQRIFDFTILATVDIQLYRDDQKVQLDYYYESQHIRWNSQQKMIQDQKQISYSWVGLFIVMIILIIGIVVFIRLKRKQIISKYDNSDFKNQKIVGIEMHYRGINE